MCHHSFQAFTVTTIFNVLMFSLAILPFGIRAISEARIALRRLRVNLGYLKEAMTLFAVQCCLNILEPEPLELRFETLSHTQSCNIEEDNMPWVCKEKHLS